MKKMVRILLLIFLIFTCTGCWDIKEIKNLALVDLIGIDFDAKTKIFTGYYQIVDPKGISSKQGSPKGTIYTYSFNGSSIGQLGEQSKNTLPRSLYTAHLHGYILSERTARNNITKLINQVELNPERRTNVPLFVTDSVISEVMNSYIPIENVPGRYLRNIVDIQAENFKNKIYPIRIKDMAKRSKLIQPTIIPILRINKPVSKASELEGTQGNSMKMDITDGAVFIRSRMVGKVDYNTKKYFYILNNNLVNFDEKLVIDNRIVDVRANILKVKKKLTNPKKDPKLTIRVSGMLRIITNDQMKPLDLKNLKEIENAFNKKIKKESLLLFKLGKEKNWDVFGIQDINKTTKDNWKDTNIIINVNSDVTTTGDAGDPYK